MESHETELVKLFAQYLDKTRNLDYLEDRYDQIKLEEDTKKNNIIVYLEKM